MNKLPGILLLLCIWAPFAGNYSWLLFEKKQIKKEIKKKLIAGLDKSELALVKIATAQAPALLDWEETSEFEYEGHMYDVVEMQEIGDSTYYWCWFDDEETQLNRRLYQLVAQALGNSPHRRENNRRLISFIQHLFYSSPPQLRLSVPIDGGSGRNAFCATGGYFPSNSLTPPKPPPETI